MLDTTPHDDDDFHKNSRRPWWLGVVAAAAAADMDLAFTAEGSDLGVEVGVMSAGEAIADWGKGKEGSQVSRGLCIESGSIPCW